MSLVHRFSLPNRTLRNPWSRRYGRIAVHGLPQSPTRQGILPWGRVSINRGFPPRSLTTTTTGEKTATEWRQRQLRKLEDRFHSHNGKESDEHTGNNGGKSTSSIENEEDLQQMWREMEGRVTRRRPRTTEEMGGRTGRTNIKRTDEELWQQEGLYDDGGGGGS